MKILLVLLAALSSVQALACVNLIAQSEIPNAIALVSGAGSKVCGGADPCVCFDGVDFAVSDFVNGAFVLNAAKKAAKDAAVAANQADQAARDAKRSARLPQLKQCVQDLKGAATVAQVKQCILLLLQDVKEGDLQTSDL